MAWIIITEKQLKEGYVVKRGDSVERRDFWNPFKMADGNYVAQIPNKDDSPDEVNRET